MALAYVEWCDKNGFDYNQQDSRDAWHRYMDAEAERSTGCARRRDVVVAAIEPAPISTGRLSGRITMTWQQERQAELRRRSYQRHWRIIWPSHPLRLISLCLLFLLTSSALLLTGCSTVSPEDRAFFYSGWVNPNSQPLGQ
jgi:hypothetical protein